MQSPSLLILSLRISTGTTFANVVSSASLAIGMSCRPLNLSCKQLRNGQKIRQTTQKFCYTPIFTHSYYQLPPSLMI